MCHCAGWLADSLADNKQLPPSYLSAVEKCSVVISLATSEMTSLEEQRRRKARF